MVFMMVTRHALSSAACLVALSAPLLAHAQSVQTIDAPNLDAQGFRPSPSAHAIHSVDLAQANEALVPALGAWLNYASAPLVTARRSGTLVPVLDQQLTLHLNGSLGIVRRAELGFELPLLMVNNGVYDGVAFGGLVAGDLAFRLKGAARSSKDHAVGLGGVVTLRLPTGDDTVFASDAGVGAASLIADTRLGPLTVAANAGVALRGAEQVRNLLYSSELTYSLAARTALLDELLSLDASIFGRTQLLSPFADKALSPLEALLGIRLLTPAGVYVNVAGGAGLVSGVTAPELRAIVSVGWAPALSYAPELIMSEEDKVVSEEDKAAGPAEEVPVDTTQADPQKPQDTPQDAPQDKPADPPAKPQDAPPRTNVASIEGDKIVFKKGEISFKFGTATLRDASLPLLDDVAALLLSQPDLKLAIDVHTDTLGDPDENIALSQKQADAVRDYLVKRGVAAERLTPKGFGGQQPIIPEEQTAEDEEINRRVELRILR
jgi:outer membrane protein OmpA-like peptidoglycan-associated protein